MGKKCTNSVKDSSGRNHLGDPDVDTKIILKSIVACRAVTVQRPRNKQIYHSRF
jgi:hypothetical protein